MRNLRPLATSWWSRSTNKFDFHHIFSEIRNYKYDST